jgi:hypothetical protein
LCSDLSKGEDQVYQIGLCKIWQLLWIILFTTPYSVTTWLKLMNL